MDFSIPIQEITQNRKASIRIKTNTSNEYCSYSNISLVHKELKKTVMNNTSDIIFVGSNVTSNTTFIADWKHTLSEGTKPLK